MCPPRVMTTRYLRRPGRSGLKRLGNRRCGVALTTPSHLQASTAVPHPRHGEVSFHARQLHMEVCLVFARRLSCELMCAVARRLHRFLARLRSDPQTVASHNFRMSTSSSLTIHGRCHGSSATAAGMLMVTTLMMATAG